MPNAEINYPVESFAVPVDSVEKLTNLDFFRALSDREEKVLETTIGKATWLPTLAGGDLEPLSQPGLPRNHFNTVVGGRYAGTNEEVTVCDTVMGSRYSKTGNLWLNFDKQYPNQIFSVFIRKQDLPNFSDDPKAKLKIRKVCFTGKVETFNGTPKMNVERGERAYPWALRFVLRNKFNLSATS